MAVAGWLALWLIQKLMLDLLSYLAQDYLPRDGATYNGLGPSALINNQDHPSLTPPEVSLK